MMFGTMFAVVYAVPRHEAWTVCANTTWRPNPITRASMVIAPISTAARPIPPPRCRALPRSATGAVTLPAGGVGVFSRTGVGTSLRRDRVMSCCCAGIATAGTGRHGPPAEHVQPVQRPGCAR